MQRRTFIRNTALSSLAVGLGCSRFTTKTHILTLSFDDGFKKSCYQIAEIFERYNLSACFNVIASGHLPSYQTNDHYQVTVRGNFDDWNILKKRGHEIMPHSWDHADLTKMPLEEAKKDIIKCLDYFKENLRGFDEPGAVYNFAYNASTPELEDFLFTRVKALRVQGETAINPIPESPKSVRFGCLSFGPNNADNWIEQQVNQFLDGSGGWCVLCLHGLDNEGWGPVSSKYLNNLLKRLVKIDFLDILPAGVVLKKYPG